MRITPRPRERVPRSMPLSVPVGLRGGAFWRPAMSPAHDDQHQAREPERQIENLPAEPMISAG